MPAKTLVRPSILGIEIGDRPRQGPKLRKGVGLLAHSEENMAPVELILGEKYGATAR